MVRAEVPRFAQCVQGVDSCDMRCVCVRCECKVCLNIDYRHWSCGLLYFIASSALPNSNGYVKPKSLFACVLVVELVYCVGNGDLTLYFSQ